MHLKSLKVFCDIVSRRNFSRAADDNGISQSGASQIVHQLEEHLGVKLLDRSKRPFVLTPEGEAYYDGCRKLVRRFYSLEEEVRTLHQEVAGRVSMASIYSAGLSHMNQLVQEFIGLYPKANVRLEYQHPGRLFELVENDEVDLGLVSYPKSSRAIKAIPWRNEPMALVCSADHPIAKAASVSTDRLNGENIVGFTEDLKIRREIDRLLSSRRIEMNVVMEFDNIETIKRAVEINAGVSLLPLPTVEREIKSGTLAAVAVEGMEMIRPLGVIHRRGKELGKTAHRFLSLLLDCAEQPPATSSPGLESEADSVKATAGSENGSGGEANKPKRRVKAK